MPACTGGRHPEPAWGSWSSTALIVLTVWATTSAAAQEFRYFWPSWVVVPWGGMLLMGSLGARTRVPGR